MIRNVPRSLAETSLDTEAFDQVPASLQLIVLAMGKGSQIDLSQLNVVDSNASIRGFGGYDRNGGLKRCIRERQLMGVHQVINVIPELSYLSPILISSPFQFISQLIFI